jgi:hypothetical protein
MKIGLETNLQATRYARNKMLGPRMGIETTFGVGNSGGYAPLGRGAFSLATSPAKAAATHTQPLTCLAARQS